MNRALFARVSLALCGIAFVAVPLLLSGCQRDAVMSEEEIKRVRQGPPKEMPPEARELMQRGMNFGGSQPPQGAPPAGSNR